MNQIVQKWRQQSEARRNPGPDSIDFFGEKITLPNKETQTKKVGAMNDPKHKATINRNALVELALRGPMGQVEALKLQLEDTIKRLKIRRFKGVEPFSGFPQFKGGYPNPHRIAFWLDDLKRGDDRYLDDLEFLKQVYVTVLQREEPVDDEE